jgi:hypothetical protein
VSTDPVVRYVAGIVLLLTFAGAMAVIVHGYWVDAHYAIPSALDALVTSAVTAAVALLGVHAGAVQKVQLVNGDPARPPPA